MQDDTQSPDFASRPRTFGRRKGKAMRRSQLHALSDLLPEFSVHLPQLAADDLLLFNAAVKETRLEIGFGSGEHLIHRATLDQDVGFIGCEPFLNGVASLVGLLSKQNRRNVRVHAGDAMEVMTALPKGSVSMIYILYPDPWPKWRQRKRRFVNDESLAAMARILKPQGRLLFATDIDDYCAWTLACVARSKEFEWAPRDCADWRRHWDDWPGTRYEEKARREGRSSAYLTFVRN